MNQILSTTMPTSNNKPNKKPVAIGSVLKFFAIMLLIFGIFMIGSGAFVMYKNHSATQEKRIEPTISIENKTDTTILLKITCQKNIEKVEYGWNNEDRTTINGNNGKYLEKEISIPAGSNTLHILVKDVEGNESKYDKQYEKESNIKIENVNNKIKISYEGDTTISYITYRWDEQDETKIDINSKIVEQEINAIKGIHTLTVVVVDENNMTDTKVQKISGVSKPKLKVSVDEQKQHFIITVSDEEKLSHLKFKLDYDDNKDYELNLDEKNLKELEYTLPMELHEGENIIEVTVTNSQGITEETGARLVK